MLPSTFEGQSSKDKKATTLRATRKDVSDFLRQTLTETGLPISAENAKKEEFSEFFRKVSPPAGYSQTLTNEFRCE
jgi:LETM1 and EF-hand domain-containing protein 1